MDQALSVVGRRGQPWHALRNVDSNGPKNRSTERRLRHVSNPAVSDVARAIEAYLAGHPGAADNEDGIATWWLPSMGIDVPVARVRQALDGLTERGVVAVVALPGGTIYRAAGRP